MNKKLVLIILIIIILTSIAAAGSSIYTVFKNGTLSDSQKGLKVDMITQKQKRETEEWKTYKNDEYGFEFNYPLYASNFSVYNEESLAFELPFVKSRKQSSKLFRLTIKNTTQTSCDWAKNHIGKKDGNSSIITEQTYGENKFITYTDYAEGGTQSIGWITNYFLKNGNSCYMFDMYLNGTGNNDRSIAGTFNLEAEQKIVEQILSTLKFTWKTYKNEKYGFEFQYPNTWGEFVSSQYIADEEEIRLPSRKGIVFVGPLLANEKDYLNFNISPNTLKFTNPQGVILYNFSYSGRGGFYDIYAFKNKEEKGIKIGLNTIVDPSGKITSPEFEKNNDAWLAKRIPEFNDIKKLVDSIQVHELKPTTVVKNKINDWKTYRNEEQGFEFQYPKAWQKKENEDFFTNNNINVLQFEVKENKNSIQEFVDRELKENDCENDHIIKKDSKGILYILYCSATTETYQYAIELINKNKVLVLSYQDNFESDWAEEKKTELFKKIISTLKFYE